MTQNTQISIVPPKFISIKKNELNSKVNKVIIILKLVLKIHT